MYNQSPLLLYPDPFVPAIRNHKRKQVTGCSTSLARDTWVHWIGDGPSELECFGLYASNLLLQFYTFSLIIHLALSETGPCVYWGMNSFLAIDSIFMNGGSMVYLYLYDSMYLWLECMCFYKFENILLHFCIYFFYRKHRRATYHFIRRRERSTANKTHKLCPKVAQVTSAAMINMNKTTQKIPSTSWQWAWLNLSPQPCSNGTIYPSHD